MTGLIAIALIVFASLVLILVDFYREKHAHR